MITHPVIRPARPGDARVLAELRWAFKLEDHEGEPPRPHQPVEQAEDWLRDRLGDGRWLAWVAESGGQVCGHVFLHLVERMPDPYSDSTPLGYVTNFYVTPPHRNRGIGTGLLDAVKRHARSTRLDTLIVWPSERSNLLYRRSGFLPPEELLELPLET
ncbi:Acetyltransferase (GNAT) family protein [Sinosporangium album]|uniref:Acetyltransferase (GNAT) family protein n=1 Tax=Sinosporangium album TaxID=504805 RepID=A0A1G7VE27_9ACTN|nr:GNAT family N-acetyltransferase [Sinosporangium album]SDG58092.1 Acetyltransferase (GNAT) family protein [Sinosporangium album]